MCPVSHVRLRHPTWDDGPVDMRPVEPWNLRMDTNLHELHLASYISIYVGVTVLPPPLETRVLVGTSRRPVSNLPT